MPELIHHHAEIIVQHRMAVMPCVVCGVLFGVSKEILDARVHYGGSLTCVNGHVMTWPGTHPKPAAGHSEAEREAAGSSPARFTSRTRQQPRRRRRASKPRPPRSPAPTAGRSTGKPPVTVVTSDSSTTRSRHENL